MRKYARHPDSGGFVVTFRDIPEAITQGESVEEALMDARDCLDEAIAAYRRRGIPIPAPFAPTPEEHVIVLSGV